jgi:endonuclease IV
LETKSTKPTELSYEKPERLNELYSAIAADPELTGHVGHCIDTAHLWSSGVTLSDKKDATMWLTAMSRAADGYLPKMLMFHLNDAQNDFASGRDVHEALTLGQIWGNDDSGLKVVLEFIKQHNLIAILERNKKGGLDGDCAVINKMLM